MTQRPYGGCHWRGKQVARGERSLNRLPAAPVVSPAAAPPPRKTPEIPLPLTPLVGREHELARVRAMLTSPDVRLLTLTGPGGIGKTRVVIQAARQAAETLQSEFPDGVYYVSLTSLESAGVLIPALASALGYVFFGQEDPLVQLIRYLQEKRLLLVLDNFEHLLEGVETITAILEGSPGIRLLLTSRERLNVQAEWVFEITGLPVPEEYSGQLDVTGLEKYSSVTLFLNTARRVSPGFSLDAENAPDVLRICRFLEGMPLGIELAASLVRTLSCAEIAAEISRSLDVLQAADRHAPERHRSLRAAFDRSWMMLSPHEQDILARLSVFRGPVRRETAQTVAGATLADLTALVDKSLLRRTRTGYAFHELVRQYAASKLALDPRTQFDACDCHSEAFICLLAEQQEILYSPRSREAVERLGQELDNIRLAWDWAAEHRNFDRIHRGAESLYYLLELRGSYLEGLTLFSQTAEKLGGWDPARSDYTPQQQLALGDVFTKEGFFNIRLGRQGQAEPLFYLAIALLQPLVDKKLRDAADTLAQALVFQATAQWHMGRLEISRDLAAQALDYARKVGNRWYAAYAMLVIGLDEHSLGHTAAAYPIMQESMFYWRQLGDPRGLTLGLGFAAIVAHAAGHVDEAREMLLECLDLSRSIGDRWGVAVALGHLGRIDLALGGEAREGAILHLGESMDIYREMAEPYNMIRAMIRLGEAYHLNGRDAEARQTLTDAIRIAWASPVPPQALDAMVMLARVLADNGAPDCALRLLAPVRQHPQCYEETRDLANAMWEELHGRVDQAALSSVKDFDRIVEQVLNWAQSGDDGGPCG